MVPQRTIETIRLTRRSFLQNGLAGSALALLAACSGQVPAPDATAPASSPAGGAAPATSGSPAAAGAAVSTRPPAAAGTTQLSIMTWGRPDAVLWENQAFGRAFPDDAKRLTILDPIIGGQGDNDVAQKFRLLLSAGGGDMPDIIRLNRIQVAEFAEAGALLDLSDYAKPYVDDMIDTAKALSTYNNKIVAIPNGLKSKLWFYRQDLFQQAGIDPDKIVTMDDFIAAARQFHEKLPKSYIHNVNTAFAGYRQGTILTSFGSISLYDRGAKKWQITTQPAFRALFETLDKLRDPALSAPSDDFTPDWSKQFADGTIASTLIAEWMKTFLPGYAPDQKGLWRAHAWPTINGSNQGSDAGSGVAVVPKGAKNAKAAADYLTRIYLTKDAALANLAIQGTTPFIKSARGQVLTMPKPEVDPKRASPLPWPPDFFGPDYYKVEFAAQERMAWIDYDPNAAKEIALMGDWAQRFLAKQANVDQTLTGLQQDLESQIGDPWRV